MARLQKDRCRTALIAPALALLGKRGVSAMEPIHSDGMPLPQSKPDLALSLSRRAGRDRLPVPRPDLQTILPRATRTVAEMYLAADRAETGKDATLQLKNGEGLGKLAAPRRLWRR